MDIIESPILNEQAILRTELQELKRCQLQYFLISLTAAGAVFGFSSSFQGTGGSNLLFLSPLLVILPCWWTFFDKATTITRLTGYIRVFIEEQLKNNSNFYFGYERALDEFRRQEKQEKQEKQENQEKQEKQENQEKQEKQENQEKQDEKDKKDKMVKRPSLWELFKLGARHRYWMINWCTFFLLSAACCIIPFFKIKKINPFNDWHLVFVYLFIVLVFMSARAIIFIVWHLIFGKYSYENVTEYWRTRVFPACKRQP